MDRRSAGFSGQGHWGIPQSEMQRLVTSTHPSIVDNQVVSFCGTPLNGLNDGSMGTMTAFSEMCKATGRTELDVSKLSDVERNEVYQTLVHFDAWQGEYARTRKPGFGIEIGFLEGNSINALAITWNSQDFIAINIGVIRDIFDLANNLMANGHIPWLQSEDEKHATARWIFDCAKHLIFFHEMGHIWNGHTSWILDKKVPYIAELEAFPLTDEESLDRRTLEFDADSFAISNLFVSAMRNRPPVLFQEMENRADGSTALYLMGFAVYVSRRIFYRAEDQFQERGTHPSLLLRQAIFLSTAGTMFFEESETNNGRLNAVTEGVIAAEKAAASHLHDGWDARFFQEYASLKWHDEEKVLLRNWHKLYPKLNELKRGGSLPLPQDLDD